MKYDRFEDARFYRLCMQDEELIAKNPIAIPRLKRRYRKALKDAQREDPLRISLSQGNVRRRYDEDGEGLTEYRILRGQWTQEEIGEYIDESWVRICSPYDCTGQLFTVNIHARQTPVGLVFIHRMGVDV